MNNQIQETQNNPTIGTLIESFAHSFGRVIETGLGWFSVNYPYSGAEITYSVEFLKQGQYNIKIHND